MDTSTPRLAVDLLTSAFVALVVACGDSGEDVGAGRSPQDPLPGADVEVLGASIHYAELGRGRPIVFVHGNPMSSYLWRNVMWAACDSNRCLAPDLVGFGQSSKLDEYDFDAQRAHFDGFMQAIAADGQERIQGVILVVHDWGGVIGLDYAARYPDTIRGIVFGDTFIRSYANYSDLPGTQGTLAQTIRGPAGESLVLEQNFFIEQALPSTVARTLSETEMSYYRSPFPDPVSRKPILWFARGWPVAGEPADVIRAVEAYRTWLHQTPVPKLIVSGTHPDGDEGYITGADIAEFATTAMNFSSVNIGEAAHFLQEDQPEAYANAVVTWERTIP
jgi:haloalkane dehalogenase